MHLAGTGVSIKESLVSLWHSSLDCLAEELNSHGIPFTSASLNHGMEEGWVNDAERARKMSETQALTTPFPARIWICPRLGQLFRSVNMSFLHTLGETSGSPPNTARPQAIMDR